MRRRTAAQRRVEVARRGSSPPVCTACTLVGWLVQRLVFGVAWMRGNQVQNAHRTSAAPHARRRRFEVDLGRQSHIGTLRLWWGPEAWINEQSGPHEVLVATATESMTGVVNDIGSVLSRARVWRWLRLVPVGPTVVVLSTQGRFVRVQMNRREGGHSRPCMLSIARFELFARDGAFRAAALLSRPPSHTRYASRADGASSLHIISIKVPQLRRRGYRGDVTRASNAPRG